MKRITILIFLHAMILSAFPQETKEVAEGVGMTHQPKYCLFYDNHTMPALPDVGANFDVEAFTNRIKKCGVDMLTFHARCNLGNAYYDTKLGTMHPSLKYDLFGKLAESCKRKNIALVAYFNGGISSSEGILHRDWNKLDFEGREYRERRFDPSVRTMCFNSPYRDHLIGMVREVALQYPVSGFFIDCMDSNPCVCPICIKEMKRQGIDWTQREDVIRFSESSAQRFAEDITKAVKKINPNFLLFFNGIGYEQQQGLCSHLECECLPNGFWGYEYLPILSHYMRTLGDNPVLNMTARFYDWGDFGSLRPEAAIKYDLLYGLANGMRPNVGGHFHPRGDLETAVLDRLEKIYKELQSMDPWFDHAKNMTEIAVVYAKPNSNLRNQAGSSVQLGGAVRMLSELKQQFDVVTEFSDWSKYKVLVIPDDITFNKEVTRRVKAHLAAGKAVISSAISGMNTEKTKFALEKEWGVKYLGDNEFDPAYYAVGKNFNQSLPDMPLSLYSKGIDLETLPGTEIEANLVKPYFHQQWDGEYAFYYNPPEEVTSKPALTLHNKVAHFSHRIFTGYNQKAPVELRRWFGNVLERFLPDPLLKTENLPSFSRAFVTEQLGRKMVHILSYVPELRGGRTQMIEEAVELHNVKIALRVDGKSPKNVYLAPGKTKVPFTSENGYIHVNIPVTNGYSLVVFEE